MHEAYNVGDNCRQLRARQRVKESDVGSDFIQLGREVLLAEVVDALMKLAICT